MKLGTTSICIDSHAEVVKCVLKADRALIVCGIGRAI